MAVGRITGQMLSSTLNRVTSDLTIRSTGEANLIQVDTSNQRVGIATASPTVPLDVTGAIKGSSTITANTLALGTGSITDSTGAISFGNENLTTTGQINSSGVRLLENEITTIRSNDDLILSANGSGGVQIEGSLTVSADLTVNGSTTTVNSTTLTVDDKNIELAHSPSGASASDTLADGGGIILKGSTNHTILWTNATDDWDFSDTIDVASGKVYKVNGTEVLSGTTITTANAVHNVISSSDSSSVRINDGLQVDGPVDAGSQLTIANTTAITAILDEDAMGSNSATALATQQSIKAYVDSEVSSSGVLTVIDDSSSAVQVTIASDDLKIAGGANITTSASGDVLTVALDTAVSGLTNLTVDNLNVNGNTITASTGDITLAPAASGDVNIGANLGLTFGDDGEKIEGNGTKLTISSSNDIDLTASNDINIPADVGLTFATAEKIESDGTDLTITVGAGGDINIPSAIGLTFGDDGEKIEGDGTDLTISSSGVLNLTATGNTAITNNATIGGTLAVSGTEISVADINIGVAGITTDSNADLVLNPGGTGVVVVDALKSNDSSVINIKDGLDIDGNLSLNEGTTVNSILDEDNMASNSATALATQQSIKAFVEAQVTASDLDFQGDAGGALSIDLDSEVLDIAGGTNINTAGDTNTLTVNLDTALTGLTSVQIDSLNLQDNSITSDSNADIEITPGGSGNTNFSKSDNQLILPQGNTAARNGNIEGSFRYNTQTNAFEGYSASGWGSIGGGSLTAVDDSSSTITVELSDNSIKFAGGANITTSVSGTTITSALDTNVTGLTNLTVDNLNVNGNTITATSGDITLAPAASGDVNIGANLGLTFGNDGEKIEGDGTDLTISSSAKLNLTATSDVHIPQAVGLVFDTAGTEKIESDGTDLTISVGAGGDINIAADIGVTFGDDGEKIEGNGTDLTISSSNDLNLTATTDINVPANVGMTFGDDGEKIEGDGTDLTIASSGKLNLTATSDVQIPANVGVLFGTGGEKIESDGTDLTATITGNFVFSGNTAIDVPVGTTGQRPSVNTGLIRFNSTLGVYEGSTDGSTYSSFLMAAAGEAADINKDVFTTSNDSTTAFALSFTPAEAQNVLVFVDNIFQESTNNYTVSGSTLTMTAAVHDGARVVVLHGFDGSGGVSGATWIGGSNTDIDSAVENVDTFTTGTYRAAEYTYVATNAEGDDSTTGHETGKILIVHDGTTAQMSQYGITGTTTTPLLTFTVDISGGSVRLRAASAQANTGVRFARLGLAPL